MESHKKRYAGLDVPIDKGIQRHAFGANEHPLIFQTLARAVQLQQQDKTRHTKTTVSSTATTTTPTLQRPTLGTGNQFAGLAAAMKNRFTTMTEETGAAPTPVGLHHMLPPKPVGLRMPPQPPRVDVDVDVESKPPPKKEEEKEKEQNQPIVLERTVQPFSPHPLVCKRFGVPAPSNSIGSSVQLQPGRLTEAAYFEKEVLTARNKKSLSLLEQQQPSRNAKKNDDTPDDETEQEPTGLERPPMEKLKSIFEPPSEEDDSSDADTDLDSVDENRKKDDGQTKDVADSQKMVMYEQTNNDDDDMVNNKEESEMVKHDSSSSDDSSSRRRRRHHHRKERRRKKHRRHRKRSRSPDDSSDSTDDRRKKERRRKQEKKRRKKSSHRKRDKESS